MAGPGRERYSERADGRGGRGWRARIPDARVHGKGGRALAGSRRERCSEGVHGGWCARAQAGEYGIDGGLGVSDAVKRASVGARDGRAVVFQSGTHDGRMRGARESGRVRGEGVGSAQCWCDVGQDGEWECGYLLACDGWQRTSVRMKRILAKVRTGAASTSSVLPPLPSLLSLATYTGEGQLSVGPLICEAKARSRLRVCEWRCAAQLCAGARQFGVGSLAYRCSSHCRVQQR